MDLKINIAAAQFYKKEMSLTEGDTITLFVRVGGVGSGGFSAGIHKGRPEKPCVDIETEGLTVCIAEDEQWYFDGMTIDYDEDSGEVIFTNDAIKDVINPE